MDYEANEGMEVTGKEGLKDRSGTVAVIGNFKPGSSRHEEFAAHPLPSLPSSSPGIILSRTMPPKNKGKKGKKQDDDEFW